LINSNFWNLRKELEKIWITKITWIYYDLWLSSLHIDQAERWFSFMQDWPLDMRFDKSKWKTASDIVNSYKTEELKEIFSKYWEEPKSSKIAKLIVERRKKKLFEKTIDLAEIIPWNVKVKSRIFQAVRIEVNKELENLEKSLNEAINLLEKDSVIFVISFHSLEDRITKNIFKREMKDCICKDLICSCKHKKRLKLINKKPIVPWEFEIKNNPRSRSAKARCAKKI
jgi:16S rRNA (cytosine1402-N4)-methyltransferase